MSEQKPNEPMTSPHKQGGREAEELEQCRRFRADLAEKVNQAAAENLEKSREIERLRTLLATCYQIAGSFILGPDANSGKEQELLLNTLASPDGPGADILLKHWGPFQEVTDAAIMAEKEQVA